MTITVTSGSRLHRWLTVPLRRTSNPLVANRSRYPWRPTPDGYVLTPLGVLHRWVGLSLKVRYHSGGIV